MKNEYEIILNNLNIIESQTEYNVQYGGYEELKHNQIIELWQNPDYNNKFLNFYVIVNKYLRGLELDIKQEWLSILKLHSKQDFTDFMIYYINRLTSIIYKNPAEITQIFYRGEIRSSFYQGIGDVVFYSTFQSVSSSISVANKFAESDGKETQLLFVMEIPKGYYYKPLITKLKYYNYKKKITTSIDEKEYLVMPNSYYVIVDKFTIYNNTNVIKMKMFYQEYYQIENNVLYEQKTLYPTTKIEKSFNSKELDNFVKLSEQYQKMVNKLTLMNSYKLDKRFYNEINNSNYDNLFNLDIEAINNTVSEINDSNIKEKAEEIKSFGLGYYDYQIKNVLKYKKRIESVGLILNTEFNSIKYLETYTGYYNINEDFKRPDFIEFLKKQKINEEFEYSKIIITHLNSDKYLYSDIYNMDYPSRKLKKNNSAKLVYYKYIIKLELVNTKVCVCSTHRYENDNNVVLIPNLKMKITEIKNLVNKYNLPYTLFKISVTNY